MMDFTAVRRNMVDGQLRTNRVTDPGLLAAFLDVPRERFVPAGWESVAYADTAVPLAAVAEHDTRVMIEPLALAHLVQAAEIRPEDSVLHIGCNSGYGTALLARLATRVRAIEDDPRLAAMARANLGALGIAATLTEGPLMEGLPLEAPFDVIVVEGAVERLPDSFARQLGREGRLVAIVNNGGTGQGQLFLRVGDRLSGFPRFTATAPVLPGFAQPAEFVF